MIIVMCKYCSSVKVSGAIGLILSGGFDQPDMAALEINTIT